MSDSVLFPPSIPYPHVATSSRINHNDSFLLIGFFLWFISFLIFNILEVY